jgi:energy-coupling factor transporter ATP-binding protein EcfA2
MRISGKNFQPWSEFDLTLDGLTLIVGPSNKGKSSIFRSLKGILRNELDSGYIRNGQDEKVEVSLEIDGLPLIAASRTRKGTTKYKIGVDEDGKPIEFKALGDSIPEPMEKLKFNKVKVGDVTMDPIFSEQNKAQFLIDTERWKPTEINTILGAFASTERLDAGKKEANLRITQKNGEAKTLAEEIREAEERKGKLTILSGQADRYAAEVTSVESTVSDTQGRLFNTYEALKRLVKVIEYQQLLSALSIPDISETEVLHRKSLLLSQAAKHLVKSKFLVRCSETCDETVVNWEPVVKVHKRKQAILSLLAIQQRGGLGPRECADQVGKLLEDTEFSLRRVSSLSLLIKSAELVMPAKESARVKEEELLKAEIELEKANGEVTRIQLDAVEVGVAKCPNCGKDLRCSTCQHAGN